MSPKELVRCPWPATNALMVKYHDEEWGVPLHNDQRHFEFIILDGMQAGLSWQTIINKRENFRKAFHNFDPKKVAKYTARDFDRLMADAGIVRNRAKIAASITNAQRFLAVQKEYGNFDSYIWQFTGGKTLVNKIRGMQDYRATSPESDAMSKDLLKRGFKFVGSTICYAYMQAAGMINDHLVDCYRYNELTRNG
jgi:DNA-3-methyladenine glycosylase I